MYDPSTGVTASTARRKTRICSQPFAVMSELLRFHHRDKQIPEEPKAREQPDNSIDRHRGPPAERGYFINRSHSATYPTLTAKNASESATNARSITTFFLSRQPDDRTTGPPAHHQLNRG